MTHLPAGAEAAASAAEEEDFMGAVCGQAASGAGRSAIAAGPLPDVPVVIGPLGSPGADMDGRSLAPRLPEEFIAMRLIAARIEAQPMVWVRQR